MVLLISIIALTLSYLLNKLMLKLFRENAVIFGAPVFEELFKTLPAYYLNRPILHVHFFFGIGEALYDLFTSRRESARWAAVVSIISHSLFGATTDYVLRRTESLVLAYFCSIVIHCTWNLVIMRVGKKNKKVVD